MTRIATDAGGTFTDLVAFDEKTGAIFLGKALTTPGRSFGGLSEALREVVMWPMPVRRTAIEARLAVSLFERRGGGYAPTAALLLFTLRPWLPFRAWRGSAPPRAPPRPSSRVRPRPPVRRQRRA